MANRRRISTYLRNGIPNREILLTQRTNVMRSTTKSQTNFGSYKVQGPEDPPAINADIRVTKRAEITLTSSPTTLTYNQLYKLIDPYVTTPFFSDMVVEKISVYGDSGPTQVTFTVTEDGGSYLDASMNTARNPHIHIRMPWLTRNTWTPTTSTNSLGVVTYGTTCRVQVTMTVRSTAFSST